MPKSTFSFLLINYWRKIDKKILLSFFILFFEFIFSYSSTSSLAGERLNKVYYFFFIKHLIYTFLAIVIMLIISFLKTDLLLKLVIPLFYNLIYFLALVPIIGVEVKGAKDGLIFTFFVYNP